MSFWRFEVPRADPPGVNECHIHLRQVHATQWFDPALSFEWRGAHEAACFHARQRTQVLQGVIDNSMRFRGAW